MPNERLIEKIHKLIQENIENEYYGVSDLAEQVGMSRSHLHRKVKTATGKSVSQLIKEIRLQNAVDLLKETDLTVSEIAYAVGFNNPSYFNKCFHEQFGESPGEARRIDQKKQLKISANHSEGLSGPIPAPDRTIFRYQYVVLIFFTIALTFLFIKSINKIRFRELERSIAVLPFENISSNSDNKYLTDGFVDDIRNRLAGIDDLMVISGTSSEMFREKSNMSIQEIARLLGVEYILEGSVQEGGGNVRINIQLIEANRDKQVWSESYDVYSDEVFGISSLVSNQVASELLTLLTKPQSV